jgi:hypothetical protein
MKTPTGKLGGLSGQIKTFTNAKRKSAVIKQAQKQDDVQSVQSVAYSKNSSNAQVIDDFQSDANSVHSSIGGGKRIKGTNRVVVNDFQSEDDYGQESQANTQQINAMSDDDDYDQVSTNVKQENENMNYETNIPRLQLTHRDRHRGSTLIDRDAPTLNDEVDEDQAQLLLLMQLMMKQNNMSLSTLRTRLESFQKDADPEFWIENVLVDYSCNAAPFKFTDIDDSSN